MFHDIAKNFERTDLPVIVFEDIDRTTDAPLQALPIDPLQPAYILFTSGTTGRPKGVVQSHAGVLAHIRNYAQNLRIVPEDHLCMLAAYCYDAAVMDMFGALLNGACLSVWNIRREGLEAMERIASEGITIFHSTPTVFRNVLNGTSKAPSHLRLVVLGGERTTRNDVQLFQRTCAANATLVNGLGPTECTIICQAFFTTDSEVEEPVAIGRPVGGLTVSLRDVQDIPVAAGSEGELVVRGAQVALGYFQRPDLTSGAFTDHADGTRSYRTGDIARELPDGQLVFLGRKDGQIKLRGHRIEPAEITNALNAHPDVSDRAVALLEIAGIAALHAWVVPARDRQPDVPALRAHAMALLPDVMVPSTFTTLEKLPLRSNGKLDMGALPAPQWPIGLLS